MLKVINLFAGPGVGKSTLASELFTTMKKRGLVVELVTEYAKDLTYEGHFNLLRDQLSILAAQNRRLERLRGQVDYAISDSPLLLGMAYRDPGYLPDYFDRLVLEAFARYDNRNFYLTRRGDVQYQTEGRNQSLADALAVDAKIEGLLREHSIPHRKLQAHDRASVATILGSMFPPFPKFYRIPHSL